MTTFHGHIPEFSGNATEWRIYAERLGHYFTANDVKSEEKKRAILLSACGTATLKLINNLLTPDALASKSFADIVKIVQEHHHPEPSAIVMRFRFNSCVRNHGESVAAFVARLRELADKCKYPADIVGEMVRDRLVCGIQDDRLQRRLLAEPKLTYDKAFELAQIHKAAEMNAKELRTAQPVTAVHATYESKSSWTECSDKPCYRCGGKHKQTDCFYRNATCNACGKKGHIAKVCRSKAKDERKRSSPPLRQKSDRTHQITEVETASETGDTAATAYDLWCFPGSRPNPMTVCLTLNGTKLDMEVDTGASASLISMQTYNKLWPSATAPPLKPTDAKLRTYTGEELTLKGRLTVRVVYGQQEATLPLLVVDGSGPSLLGRDWLSKIKLDWQSLNNLQTKPAPPTNTLQDVLQRHKDVFKKELGTVTGVTAKIYVDPSAQPRFCKPRTVPYALRAKVDQELERLEQAGVIEPIQFADWAAPIVPVMKRDGSVRICGDYKVTVNQAAKVDSYPLPRIDDLFASLTGGKKFSKLDLAHAYQQIPLAKESRKLVVINTNKGLFRYKRLPFGIASAPAIFQRTIEGILREIPRVCVYLDDILVTGKTEAEHLRNLESVLTKLEAAGMRLKREKCAFLLDSVEYLGHNISAEGLRPNQEKVRAIAEASAPQNTSQLRAFLGLVNYYGKFLPQLSSTVVPLYRLLENQTKWSWDTAQEDAFRAAKQQLTSPCLLVHYDPDKELVLACDASPYGVGAVLSHKMPDGSEKPVAFASRSLSVAEKKYAQLDKKGLAIVFGVNKFHQFLLGRKFEIRSDHKPLQHLFNENRPVPPLASARIQRWALTLGAYDYTISYKPGDQHANADSLSRLPLPTSLSNVQPPTELVLLMETLQEYPVTARDIRKWTNRDPLLSKIRNLVLNGWRDGEELEMHPFNKKRNELSVQDGCVLWGSRVVIPAIGRDKVLDQLHDCHPGVSRMKGLARSMVWWPGIDKNIENKVKGCQQCQEHQKSPAQAPLHPWDWPDRPWSRIHIDHAGPFLGKTFLVVVDAHSKWLEVMIVSSTAAQCTIQKLRTLFATHGIPEIIVSDNGTGFTSNEFQMFVKRNGIRHVTSAPYHPASNGLAERAVQTFKDGLRKAKGGDLEAQLARFLIKYRNIPHSTTGTTPAELLMGRKPRTHLSLIHPNLATRVQEQQDRQKSGHDQHTKLREFSVNAPVFVRDFATQELRWVPGTITEQKGFLTFHVQLTDG